jgi:selenocysteine lyase/cysteine desulfurase
MINGLNRIKKVACYSAPNPAGIVAFSIDGVPSNEVADLLSRDYDLAVRGGLHCAPLMHEFLKTDGDGLVRASVAVQNSTREINYFLNAVENISKSF